MAGDISIKGFPVFVARNYRLAEDQDPETEAKIVRDGVTEVLNTLSGLVPNESISEAIQQFTKEHPPGTTNLAGIGSEFGIADTLTRYLHNDIQKAYKNAGLSPEAISIIEKLANNDGDFDDFMDTSPGADCFLRFRIKAIGLIRDLDAEGQVIALKYASERASDEEYFFDYLEEAIPVYKRGGKEALKKFESGLGW